LSRRQAPFTFDMTNGRVKSDKGLLLKKVTKPASHYSEQVLMVLHLVAAVVFFLRMICYY
jgi:hypothetical protein